jgi:hypothetical protein
VVELECGIGRVTGRGKWQNGIEVKSFSIRLGAASAATGVSDECDE